MRHAETLFNLQKKIQGWCDSPLTERGIKQAKAAGVLIRERGITFDHAYCSTAERCSDTLEITTAEAFGKPMDYVRCKGLREYGFGQFEGKDECLNPKAPFGTFFKAYGGESDDEVIARIGNTMHEIMAELGMPHNYCVTLGGHAWYNSRYHLNAIAPLLFKDEIR
jgi:probable phosphoglycerate mutase